MFQGVNLQVYAKKKRPARVQPGRGVQQIPHRFRGQPFFTLSINFLTAGGSFMLSGVSILSGGGRRMVVVENFSRTL